MSIRKMIALHPDVEGHVNQPLGDAAPHLMYCALMCLSCADACAAEKMDMRECIRMCLDCADVCEAAGKLAVRRTGSNEQVLREMLELCARVCDACAAECEKHDHEHCKHCAQLCRECAEDCRNAAASIWIEPLEDMAKALLARLDHPLDDHIPFQALQMIDEQHAVQMVDLML